MKTRFAILQECKDCLRDLSGSHIFIKSGKRRGEVDLLQVRTILQSHVNYLNTKLKEIDMIIDSIEG